MGAQELYGAGGYKGIGVDPDVIPASSKLNVYSGQCWRYATKPSQGQGWCKYTGASWIWPEPLMEPLSFTNANNEPINLIMDEATGRWYQVDMRIAPTNSTIVNSFTDKRTTTPDNGAEIATAGKFGEHIGATEDQLVEHLETHLRLRPQDEANRSATGYDSAGYRTNFKVDVNAYTDGVQTATESTEHIPINGDITFAEKVEGNRVQIGFTTDTSEFKIVSQKSDYLEKFAGGNDTKRTMSEMTYQENLGSPVLWMSRWLNPTLNLATGVDFGGAYDSLVADMNGDSYAVKFNGAGDGFTYTIPDLSGDFTIFAIIGSATLPCTLYKKGVLDIHIVAGRILHYEDAGNAKTRTLAWTGVGFCYLKICRSGATLIIGEAGADDAAVVLASAENYTGMDYIGTNAVITIPDFRIYDEVVNSGTNKYWYTDLTTNNGANVLPRW